MKRNNQIKFEMTKQISNAHFVIATIQGKMFWKSILEVVMKRRIMKPIWKNF